MQLQWPVESCLDSRVSTRVEGLPAVACVADMARTLVSWKSRSCHVCHRGRLAAVYLSAAGSTLLEEMHALCRWQALWSLAAGTHLLNRALPAADKSSAGELFLGKKADVEAEASKCFG